MERIVKIGTKIEVNELKEVSEIIVKKALRVIETSGNKWASNIIEGRDKETFEDLKSIVILELIESDYIITKNCYKKINSYLYNYKVDKLQNVEIVINEDSNASNVDLQAFVNYERNINESISKNSFNINELNLTKKQIEILNIYSKMGSYGKTAEVLGMARGTIQNTIERIRKKALITINNIEY